MRARRSNAAACDIHVEIVRTLEQFTEVVALRAVVFMGEQDCPFEEEFDGNDLVAATHLIARIDGRAVGAVRIRWFAEFAKLERALVLADYRTGPVMKALVRRTVDLCERRGYARLLGHVQERLLGYWKFTAGFRERPNRPRFQFSDCRYVEVERALTPSQDAIGLASPPLILLRPDGDWDRPGVLDRSAARPAAAWSR